MRHLHQEVTYVITNVILIIRITFKIQIIPQYFYFTLAMASLIKLWFDTFNIVLILRLFFNIVLFTFI